MILKKQEKLKAKDWNQKIIDSINHETKVASFDCWITEEGVVCGKCYSCDDQEGIKKYFKCTKNYFQGRKNISATSSKN